MVKPSPWGASEGDGAASSSTVRTATPASDPPSPRSARAEAWERRRTLARSGMQFAADRAEEIRTSPRLSGKWGYVVVALGGVIDFILMFKHWMVARGPDGMAAATPFGQVDSTTRYLSVWSSKGPPPAADLTGSWAMAASSMIALTIAAVAIHIATNSERFARIATGGAVMSALLMLANMLYLTARQKELKNMTGRKWDLGGQLGSWINWAVNDGSKPVAGLNQVDYVATSTITTTAIAAVIIAVGSAVVAVANLPRNAAGGRSPWRISISREASTNYTASGTEPAEKETAAPTAVTSVVTPAPAPPAESEMASAPTAADGEPPAAPAGEPGVSKS